MVPTAAIPPAGPPSPLGRWRVWHSSAVVLIVAMFVYMATRRPWDMYHSWLVTMAVLAMFTLIVGHGVTGVWLGALVDERNRLSLSRLQLVIWTVLVVSAFGTMVVGRLAKTPQTEADIVAAMDIAVPSTIWILLGISTTSFIGSPLIKNAKKDADLALSPERETRLLRAQGKNPAAVDVEGQLVKNKLVADATLADLFMGETVDNAGHLDVGKLQMFFFTILLVMAYAFSIGALLRRAPYPTSLPDIGEGMLPLLGISHAGYLMSKATSSAPPAPPN